MLWGISHKIHVICLTYQHGEETLTNSAANMAWSSKETCHLQHPTQKTCTLIFQASINNKVEWQECFSWKQWMVLAIQWLRQCACLYSMNHQNQIIGTIATRLKTPTSVSQWTLTTSVKIVHSSNLVKNACSSKWTIYVWWTRSWWKKGSTLINRHQSNLCNSKLLILEQHPSTRAWNLQDLWRIWHS